MPTDTVASSNKVRRRRRLRPFSSIVTPIQYEEEKPKLGSPHSGENFGWYSNDMKRYLDVFEGQPILLFALLVAFRLLNVMLIRSAFDPDEYWQTLEPAYCTVFGDSLPCNSVHCCQLTWEWTRRVSIDHSSSWLQRALNGPVRSYLSVLPTDLLYRCLRGLALDESWLIARGPMLLQAITVAAPVDWLTWYTARHIYDDAAIARWALFGTLTSWFGAFCWVRTYANCQEAVLLLAALALVAKGIARWDPFIFVLGGIAVGIRFTAVVAFVPLGLLLARRRCQNAMDFVLYVMHTCAFCGLLGLMLSLVVDRIFYGFWALPFLGSFHFNAILGMANLYGSHPWHWYVTAGVPAVAGLVSPMIPVALWYKTTGPKGDNNVTLLQSIVVCYIAVLSMSPHKEFRFLLPTLPLFIVLAAPNIERLLRGRPTVVLLWIIINVGAVGFLGLFHQSGAISVNQEIVQTTAQHSATTAAPTLISIHYLLPCHTTPSRSHLHSRDFQVREVWHLDCSPSCRVSNTCESEAFAQDPQNFLRGTYPQLRTWPDFVVAMSETEDVLLEAMPSTFRAVARFPYTLTGIQWKSFPSVQIATRDVVLFSRLNPN